MLAKAGKTEEDVQAALLTYMKTLQGKQFIRKPLTIKQLLNPTSELVVDSVDDEELLETIIEANQEAPEVDDDVPSEIRHVPVDEALTALKTLREWVLQQPQDESDFLRSLSNLSFRLQKAKVEGLQQSTLDRYFY